MNVDQMQISDVDTQTLLVLCQVSRIWRLIANTCYTWSKLAAKYKIVGVHCNSCFLWDHENFRPLCHSGVMVRRKLRWKKHFTHGKYVKRFLPSLHSNIFEEREKFSSCFTCDDRRLGSFKLSTKLSHYSASLLLKFCPICANRQHAFIHRELHSSTPVPQA